MKEEIYLEKLGKKIGKLRETMGISQREMSRKLETSNTHYRRIEAGEVSTSISTLRKIAEEFGISVGELVEI